MRRRLVLLGLLSAATGCLSNLFGNSGTPANSCSVDSDCPGAQTCFVDGCGAVGDDLVAEVISPSPATSEDLALGHPHAGQVLTLTSQAVQLSVRRGSAPFPGAVALAAAGSSLLLPGVARSTSAVQASVSGQLLLPISSGTYTLVVTPSDPSIPPAVQRSVVVDSGVTVLTVDLLPASAVQTLAGTALAGPGQPEPTPPQLQILAADGTPLSSITAADDSGHFSLTVAQDALSAGTAMLQSAPTATPSTRATLAFAIPDPTRFAQPFLIGDGVPTVQVTGSVLAADGSPVGGATVLIEGTVAGGGTATAGPVSSAQDGTFSLTTLPQHAPGSLRLWIFPPPGSAAGLLRTPLAVPAGGNVTGSWTCPVRPLVLGAVLLPDAGPAAGLTVRADPIEPAHPGLPEPATGETGTTDSTGHFAVRLDPALYLLEVQPGPGLPLLRTFRRVTGTDDPALNLVMHSGRSFTAQVHHDGGSPVNQALVRIHRPVSLDDGTRRALPLGEGLSDSDGKVEILLPVQ